MCENNFQRTYIMCAATTAPCSSCFSYHTHRLPVLHGREQTQGTPDQLDNLHLSTLSLVSHEVCCVSSTL
ncbi:rCG56124 [Rattus norvegicus]|uniref:RCG56124 n=1 Tax=Rattus norvegicus TaxID=10116 RepID=A6IB99_RAT|nr:rCG56124 [Rattus norvegicus]